MQQILQLLREAPLASFGLPAEWLQDPARTTELHLATLDIVLFELYQTVERFPDLRSQVEEIVLSWNYCKIRERRSLWDIAIRQGVESLTVPAEPMPVAKQGLGAWGFLHPDPPGRLVPELLSEAGTDHRGYQNFLHRIYREHCFPHPESGMLPDEEMEPPFSGPLREPGKPEAAQPATYPYSWSSPCEPPPPKPTAQPVVVQKPVPSPPLILPIAEAKPRPSVQKAPPVQTPAPTPTPQLQSKEQPPLPVPDVPVISAQPPSAAADYLPTPLPPPGSLGFSGNILHNLSLEGTPSMAANLSWRYDSAWFVRAGANIKYLAENQAFGYSWGFGYDDWHPGTISLQVNNWGPIIPSNQFATQMKGAQANLGYKLDVDLLQENHMGTSVSLNVPFQGHPAAMFSWQWEFLPTWFVRIGLIHGFNHDAKLSWTYNFGRYDWHPFTWSLTYNNWGPNTAFQPNFVRNGSVMLGWGWAF